MLRAERDWCHEDLADVAVPPWLTAIAKSAGLRWEGLTWSYLVLRHDGRTVRDAMPAGVAARMVSQPIVTKGKTEAHWCGVRGDGRVMELDRAVKGVAGPHLRDLPRGTLVVLDDGSSEGDERVRRLEPRQWRVAWPPIRG